MTSSEAYPPSLVPNNHEAALASLGCRELTDLEESFRPSDKSWRLVLQHERLDRQRDVDTMRTHLPSSEGPAYDPEAGPEGFFEQVRRFNRTLNIVAPAALKAEKKALHELADVYVSQQYPPNMRYTLYGRNRPDELTQFFEYNLRGIILPSRLASVTAFEAAKYKTMRKHMPGLQANSPSIKYRMRDTDLTRADIAQAKEAVLALRHTTALPDFFQMQTEHQEAIVTALGAEWKELCDLMAHYDPQDLGNQAVRLQGALAYRSVAELRVAIAETPSVEPGQICRLFLRQAADFDAALEVAKTSAEQQKLLAAQREAQQAGQRSSELEHLVEALTIETPGRSENLREIERLTADPDISDEILDAAYGDEVAITTPDTLVTPSKFDEIANKHSELIGRAMWELMDDKNTQGVRIERSSKSQFDVGAALRGKHRGNMRNLTIKRIPVTAEEMQEELKHYDPIEMSPENAVRLIFLAEMKPTGRKPEQTYLSMIMTVSKRSRGQDVISMNKDAARATGSDVALSLRLDSEARARAAEIGAWKAPALRTGLPSLGRSAERSTQPKR